MQFKDINPGTWFKVDGELYQRLPNTTSANAYRFHVDRGGLDYFEPDQAIEPAIAPIQLTPHYATRNEVGIERVLYWHSCGYFDICPREQLIPGEPFFRMSRDFPRLDELGYFYDSTIKSKGSVPC